MIILPMQSVYCPKDEFYFIAPEGLYSVRDGMVYFTPLADEIVD